MGRKKIGNGREKDAGNSSQYLGIQQGWKKVCVVRKRGLDAVSPSPPPWRKRRRFIERRYSTLRRFEGV